MRSKGRQHIGHLKVALTIVSYIVFQSRYVDAQNITQGKLERQLNDLHQSVLRPNEHVPLGRRVLADYGGFATFSYISLDDLSLDNHILRRSEVGAYARINIDEIQDVFLRGVTAYEDFNDRDSFDGRGDEWIKPDLERAIYHADLRRLFESTTGRDAAWGLDFEIGRDYVNWANGLALGATLDGVSVTASSRLFNLRLLAGITPTRTVDFDSTRPEFDHNTRRWFYGVMLSKDIGRHRPYIYFLQQEDTNDPYKRDFGITQPNVDRFGYDSKYFGVGSTGSLTDQWRYSLEVTHEVGKTQSTIPSLELFPADEFSLAQIFPYDQSTDPIAATAADIVVNYLAPARNHLRLDIECILATGDHDRQNTSSTVGGNRTQTTDLAFNALGNLNTGLAFAPAVSNLICARAGISLFPLEHAGLPGRLQVGADELVYGKMLKDGPIDEPTQNERYLGCESDFYMNYQLSSDVTLALRYGVFFPGDAIGDNSGNRQFFFAGVTYAF